MLRLLGHPHSRVLDCCWKLTGRPKTVQAFRDWPRGLSLRQGVRGGSPKCRKPLIINKLLAGRAVSRILCPPPPRVGLRGAASIPPGGASLRRSLGLPKG